MLPLRFFSIDYWNELCCTNLYVTSTIVQLQYAAYSCIYILYANASWHTIPFGYTFCNYIKGYILGTVHDHTALDGNTRLSLYLHSIAAYKRKPEDLAAKVVTHSGSELDGESDDSLIGKWSWFYR